MGIRGLASFIQRNFFLEKYQLHDTKLVVHGNSVFRQLFQIHSTEKNSCFGGDYDKFADYVDEFFEMLDNCKVIPCVVFDGGIDNEAKKKKLKNMSNRLMTVKSIDSSLDESNGLAIYLPLCLEDVFESIVLKRKIKTIRCDFESYTAILSIAKNWDCPVLSYDSDYFMCSEIAYIPVQSLCNCIDKPFPYVMRRIKPTEFKYIPCQIFKVNQFLESLRLTSDKLPLLAAMLGNSYIDTREFPKFYLWPVQNCSFLNRITNIASWIRSRSVETAIEDILKLASHTERASLKLKLQQAMRSYKCYKSKYLFDLGIVNKPDLPENYLDIENGKLVQRIPEAFLKNYRKCRYSAPLINIFIHNWYGSLKPQIQNMSSMHSHFFSEKIISGIQKILTNCHSELLCIVIEGGCMVQKKVPLCKIDVPSFLDIQEMDIEDRKLVLLKILELDFLKADTLQDFPETYQLFIVIILYLHKHSSLAWPLCYSLVLCKMILQEVDDKKGRLIRCCEKNVYATHKRQSVEDKETTEMLHEMENFIKYFQMRGELRRNADLFDINLVHSMSQFQSCLLHISVLNDLLNMPLQDFLISDCFNGTFIYNFSKVLEQSDMDDFIKKELFEKSPKIMANFQSIIIKIRKIAEYMQRLK